MPSNVQAKLDELDKIGVRAFQEDLQVIGVPALVDNFNIPVVTKRPLRYSHRDAAALRADSIDDLRLEVFHNRWNTGVPVHLPGAQITVCRRIRMIRRNPRAAVGRSDRRG